MTRPRSRRPLADRLHGAPLCPQLIASAAVGRPVGPPAPALAPGDASENRTGHFWGTGPCAVLVEIAPGCAGSSDRPNHLVVDLDHDTATEQKQVWQLGEQRGDRTDDLGESYRQLRRASPYTEVS
jgi:hypothetical protein